MTSKRKISPIAKLTAAQVRYVRRNVQNVSQMQLARKCNVSQATISKIINNKIYTKVA